MKKILVLSLVVCVIFSSAREARGPEANPKGEKKGNTYVLLVNGINKEPQGRQANDKAVIGLRRFFLEDIKLDPRCVRVLVDEESFARDGGAKVSSAEGLKRALMELAESIGLGDRFIFYYVGQANVVANNLRFNLRGEDITHEQLAEWIGGIKSSSMLIVLDCPGAGLAIKTLTAPGRIIVCGARSDQPYSTRFSEYFVPALADKTSDTNGDGKTSLLEAFAVASKRLDDLYREQDLLKTETPLLEDNGDGIPSQRPWRYEEYNGDGLAASKFFFSDQLFKESKS